MILLAAALLAGDVWTWDVVLRYETPDEGALLVERERWTVRIGAAPSFAAERRYVGSVVDGALIPASGAKPEIVAGKVAADGTMNLEADWSDPAARRVFRRLLNPARTLADRVPGWPIVRAARIAGVSVHVPGSDLLAEIVADATLAAAHLGGRDRAIASPAAQTPRP